MFVTAVAKGRDVPVADVRKGFGEGRMVMAKKALDMGMVDRVATLGETIRRLEKKAGTRAEPGAHSDESAPAEGAELEAHPAPAGRAQPRNQRGRTTSRAEFSRSLREAAARKGK